MASIAYSTNYPADSLNLFSLPTHLHGQAVVPLYCAHYTAAPHFRAPLFLASLKPLSLASQAQVVGGGAAAPGAS